MVEQFWKLPQRIGSRTDLPASAKVVYSYLNNLCGLKQVKKRIGIREIAANCGMAKSTCQSAIDALVVAGEIRVISPTGNPAGNPNRYEIQGQRVPKSGTYRKSVRTGNKPDHVPESGTPLVPESGTQAYRKSVQKKKNKKKNKKEEKKEEEVFSLNHKKELPAGLGGPEKEVDLEDEPDTEIWRLWKQYAGNDRYGYRRLLDLGVELESILSVLKSELDAKPTNDPAWTVPHLTLHEKIRTNARRKVWDESVRPKNRTRKLGKIG